MIGLIRLSVCACHRVLLEAGQGLVKVVQATGADGAPDCWIELDRTKARGPHWVCASARLSLCTCAQILLRPISLCPCVCV
jgi:hypothetical protein